MRHAQEDVSPDQAIIFQLSCRFTAGVKFKLRGILECFFSLPLIGIVRG